jgi:hypothetical protein
MSGGSSRIPKRRSYLPNPVIRIVRSVVADEHLQMREPVRRRPRPTIDEIRLRPGFALDRTGYDQRNRGHPLGRMPVRGSIKCEYIRPSARKNFS